MIDKKSILAEMARPKKPSISIEIEKKSEPMAEEKSASPELACPHCGAMIKLAVAKPEMEEKESESEEMESEE